MLDILDILYSYIQENRTAYYLSGDPEYCLTGRRMDEMEKWLETNLPPEAKAWLKRLAVVHAEWGFRYERALFRYGLDLGLELVGSGRLPG